MNNNKKSTTAIEGDMSDKIKPKLISCDATLNQLSQGGVLIAHSPQLANDWKYRYSIQQTLPACETPNIYTWSAWLSELFKQTSERVCLKPMQEQRLWQQTINEDLIDITESSLRGLAKQASQAYGLIQSYQISTQALLQTGNDETLALLRWMEAIHAKLNQSNHQPYILKADIASLLHTQQKSLTLPAAIMLDGFEHFTPIQAQHLAMYAKSGSIILQVQQQAIPHNIALYPCQDTQAEYQHIALQSRSILEQQPQARIALISAQPSQAKELSALKRSMQKTLATESCLYPEIQQQTISTQEVLTDHPMVQQALHLLTQCAQHEISFEDFSILLFCPWIRGFEKERMARASLDALFRRQNRHRIQLKHLTTSTSLQATPALKNCIEHIITWQQNITKKQSCAHWIKICQHFLQHCGFIQAGLEHESIHHAVEIQVMNTLHECISQLIALDAVQPNCSWSHFLTCLRTTCAETSVGQAINFRNISVLSMQQAIGMQFDYIFIYGMDNANFPPIARPQSFLPIRIQHDYHIPMSHSSLVFESCQWLWQHIQYAAPHIMLSYATERDEQAMQASSFVAHLAIKQALYDDALPQHWELEDFDDTQTIAVADAAQIRGGTHIIKHQSACPFRAFAVHRLRIESLGETTPGIEPSTKGSLIHLALEYIWQQLLTQQSLLDISLKQRQKLINDSIEHAWKTTKKPIDFHSQRIEHKRMYHLLIEWLELESKRPPFQIEALEKTYQLSLPTTSQPALSITIKADRMDKDAQDHRLLIDYKTGQQQSSSQWLGERMAEPQLPMYALAANLGNHDGVSFASVRSGESMGFEGLSGEDMGIKGLTLCDGKRHHPDDWQAVLVAWEEQLNALAAEFIQGHSDVTPRDHHACDYCKLEAICRIDEQTQEKAS